MKTVIKTTQLKKANQSSRFQLHNQARLESLHSISEMTSKNEIETNNTAHGP